MQNYNKPKIILLACFVSASGSKLVQSQLESSKEVLTIPAYPLLYFYDHWNDWTRKYKKLNSKLILNLLIKHHESLFDSRKIKGFNGLTKLGKKKNKYIKISRKKFNYFFLNYLNGKKIDRANVLEAIHFAYFKSRGNNLNKIKYYLFHIHNYEFISKYFCKDYSKFTMLLCLRGPIDQFWRRVQAHKNIEKQRYDYTDQEYIKNYNYFTMLRHFCMDFRYIGEEFYNKKVFIKFEDLKTNNIKTLKKICSKIQIKFNSNMKHPKFGGLDWWSDKIYIGSKNNKKFKNDPFIDDAGRRNNFFRHEVFIIENLMRYFYSKFGYKNYVYKQNLFSNITFFLYLLLPTKSGIKLFLSRFNLKNIKTYIKRSFRECFIGDLKDYYFNAFYKHKWVYRIIFLVKYNFLRKIVFKNRNNKSIFFLLSKILLFCFKLIKYPYMQLELILFYFVRIFYLSFYYLLITSKKRYSNEFKI